jgi:hypothetical protein
MPEVNWMAVVAAAVAGFAVGGLWYSPLLFSRAWQREVKLSDEDLKNANMGVIFGGTFVLSLIASAVFAMFLGPHPSLALGVGAGFAAGAFWVGTSFGISYLFERRSMKLFLINAGYHTLQFTAIGAVIAALS